MAVEVATSRYAPRPVLPFGGPSLVEVLREGEVTLLADDDDPTGAAAVIAGWDNLIDSDRLQRAAQALWAGADLLVTGDAPMGLDVGATAVLTTTGTHAAHHVEATAPRHRPHLVVDELTELIAAWPGLDTHETGTA